MLAGCDVVFPLREPQPDTIDASEPDTAMPDAPPGTCFGTALVQVCFAEPPSQALELLTGTDLPIDTDSAACTPYVSKSTVEDPMA